MSSDYMDRFLDEQENMALTNMSSSSSSLNNIQTTNRQQLHQSFRSSPSTQNLSASPHKSDHILMDDLSTHYANINSLCDSVAAANASHMSAPSMSSYVNGYYKKSDNNSDSNSVLLCSSVGSAANAKVCHSSAHHSLHPTSDWVAQQQQSVTTSNTGTNSPEVNTETIRRHTISSTTSLINDNNINSNNKTNSA